MIACGFCGQATSDARCANCHHDPALPYLQRGQQPVEITAASRHHMALDTAAVRLRSEGVEPTVERLAERLGVDARTVRRWRADVRSVT